MKHIRPNLSIQFYLRLLVKLSSMIDENYSYPYYNTYNQKKIESGMISNMKMNKRMNKKTRSKIDCHQIGF